MTSPYPSSRPASRGPASPTTNSYGAPNEDLMGPPPPRLMQVKVLYTFDDTNKTNCLARCKHPWNIQTVPLDSRTQIGIVELRTCIDAIVSGSPELIPKLGRDYTVYAYDYSEYETPLVGQGMLSRVLAATSSTPTAPAHESRTMVTGRVCRNVLGLFSDGVTETLEVKLKLVPVPTSLQNEYVSGMERCRDTNSLVGSDFDMDAWSAFVRAHPGLSNTQEPRLDPSGDAGDKQGLQTGAKPMDDPKSSDHIVPEKSTRRDVQPHNHFICYGPAPTNPALRSDTPSQQFKSRTLSRPSSRASNRGQVSRRHSTSEAPSHATDDGPAKKRARTTKANWNGQTAFGQNSDSLRVAASTAASMRGLTAAPAHPSASDIAAGELGIRPPTPRPSPVIPKRQRGGLKRSKTALAHDAIVNSSYDRTSPKSNDFPLPESAIALSSPEKDGSSAASTPVDMPSSPPVMPVVSPSPSSPVLPELRQHPDSGFASGTLEECHDTDIDDLRPLDADGEHDPTEHPRRMTSCPSDLSITEEVPGDPSLLPRRILPRPRVRGKSQHTDVAGSSPRLLPTRRGSMQASTETVPTQHVMGKPSLYPMADSPSAVEDLQENPSQAGSGLKRKKAVQSALMSSIAAGEMPRFCKNCGEIDTPTWRKAFVRIENGSPDHLQVSENDDGITAWEVINKDDDNIIQSYRIIKKNVNAEEKDQYEEIALCNPCGMWLYKQKSMRPYEVWNKAALEAGQPKKRPAAKKKKASTKDRNMDSEADVADAPPAHLTRSDSTKSDADHSSAKYIHSSMQPRMSPFLTRTAEATEGSTMSEPLLNEEAAAAALQKAFLSSPPKFPGSKRSPINIDAELTPQPTRRTLFPSPRRPGEIKSLEQCDLFDVTTPTRKGLSEQGTYENDKENLNEQAEQDEGAITSISSPCDRNLLRTPMTGASRKALTPKGFLSSAARRWRDAPETPSRVSLTAQGAADMTPFTAQLCQLLFDNNQSPSRSNDLSSLFGEQAMHDQSAAFAFSDFSAEDFASIPLTCSAEGALSLSCDNVASSDAFWNSDALVDDGTFEQLVDGHDSSTKDGDYDGAGLPTSTSGS